MKCAQVAMRGGILLFAFQLFNHCKHVGRQFHRCAHILFFIFCTHKLRVILVTRTIAYKSPQQFSHLQSWQTDAAIKNKRSYSATSYTSYELRATSYKWLRYVPKGTCSS
ncbi:hypothetical protein [Bacteroides intestinalis]|uniref:hypothetical protein n=1 Tax=Bacteroides intestinalis TaxID=329854 RepID=UPI0022E0373B|nr:hypothetical protein [Bacteroides intestinalis]